MMTRIVKKWLNKSELNLVHKTQIFHPQTNTIGWPIWADLKIIGFGRTSSKTHLIVLYFTQKWQYTNMRYKQNSYKCYNLTTIWHQIPRLRYHQKLWCLFPSYKVVQRKKCVEKSEYKQSPKISIFKPILKASKTLSYNAKVILWHSCNVRSVNPLQRAEFQFNKGKDFVFSSEKHLLELLALFGSFEELSMLPTSQGRFVQIYRDFINIESEISQILMKCFEIWKENCEGEWLGFSQDGAGGFFPEIIIELFSNEKVLNIIVDNPTNLIDWISPVGICVFAMEALKKKIFSTLLRHVPLIISIIVSISIRDNFFVK